MEESVLSVVKDLARESQVINSSQAVGSSQVVGLSQVVDLAQGEGGHLYCLSH